MLTLLAAFVVMAALGTSTPAQGEDEILFDFEGPYLIDPGFALKDHALFWSGDQWHCFYIRGDEFGSTVTEDELGHAVSSDLRNWTILPPAIVAGPASWDSRNVWAPTVIDDPRAPGQPLMLYTGANDLVVQRLGFATPNDPDLLGWTKSAQNPVFEPDPAAWVWAVDEPFSSFRDPFYFFEDGLHHLLHTARLPDAQLAGGKRGAVHHATSTDFQTWVDAGPLAVHNGAFNAWHELESVQLHQDPAGLWHLFFSETAREGSFHMSSSTFDAGWDVVGALLFDTGFAPEVTPLSPNRYLFSRHAVDPHLYDGSPFAAIRVDSLSFDLGTGLPVKIPITGLGDDWPVQTGTAFLSAPTFGDNSLERGEAPTAPVGHGYLSSREFYGGPASNFGSPGSNLGGGATGTMKSRDFLLRGTHLRLLVGGSNDPDVYVALVDAATDELLFTARGDGSTTMQPVEWFIGDRTGTTAHLLVEDASTSGYINVDEVRLRNVEPVSDLAVTALIDPPFPEYGETIEFSTRVTNTGPDAATGIEVLVTRPPGLFYLGANSTAGNYEPVSAIWSLASLEPGASAVLAITLSSTSAVGSAAGMASVQSLDQLDFEPGNDSASAAVVYPTTLDVPIVQDSWLEEDKPQTNYGSDRDLESRLENGNNRRVLLQFDLSAVPAGAEIVESTLGIYVLSDDDDPVQVHRVTSSWQEGTVNWQTAASDYDAAVTGSFIPDSRNQFATGSVTPLVQVWASQAAPNHGMMLLSTSNKRSKYSSRERNSGDQSPYLSLVYRGGGTRPLAANDGAPTPIPTPVGSAVTIDVLANDSDPDGSLIPATVTVVGAPSGGSTSVDVWTGRVTYSPAPGFQGSDNFQYVVSDDAGNLSNPAVVYVLVQDSPTATPAAPGMRGARMLPNVPNPFNPVTSLRVQLDDPATVQISVYDAQGRRTFAFPPERLAAGLHSRQWRGVDTRGQGVASGVYFAVLRVEGRLADTRRIVLVR